MINPNTSVAVTDTLAARVRDVAGAGVTIVPATGRFGARYIASRAALAIAGGTLAFDPTLSALGRAGIRAGTSFKSGNLTLAPFAAINVWHEFADSASATVLLGTAPIPLSATRLGTFYQGSGGASVQVSKTAISGFVRGDLRWGDNINGWAVLGGGRYAF